MIQVEMPKWMINPVGFLAMCDDGDWAIYNKRPTINDLGGWGMEDSPDSTIAFCIKVIGFEGDWKDSLHQYVDGKWEKVK